MDIELLKYPIGKFKIPQTIEPRIINDWIDRIEILPKRLKSLVSNLSDTQLNTPYRPGGWTVRQVVHHIPDSHLNSYIRFKWTLTENNPVIKTYDEQAWANLFDTKSAPIGMSITFLETLHIKWVYLLRGLKEQELGKCFIHPATKKEITLKVGIGLYAWHGDHHYAHIENLLKVNNW